jgi:hypothetical protein
MTHRYGYLRKAALNWRSMAQIGIIGTLDELNNQAYCAVQPIAQSVELRTFKPWAVGSV